MTMIETNLAEQRTALQRQQRDLRERLPSLALQAAHGDATAEAEITRAEVTIAAAGRRLERLDLAARESARLAAEDQRRAADERFQALKAAHQRAVVSREAAYQAVEQVLATLSAPIADALAAGAELDRAANELGTSSRIVPWVMQVRQRIAERSLYVLHQAGLAGALPMGYGHGATPLATIEEGVKP